MLAFNINMLIQQSQYKIFKYLKQQKGCKQLNGKILKAATIKIIVKDLKPKEK